MRLGPNRFFSRLCHSRVCCTRAIQPHARIPARHTLRSSVMDFEGRKTSFDCGKPMSPVARPSGRRVVTRMRTYSADICSNDHGDCDCRPPPVRPRITTAESPDHDRAEDCADGPYRCLPLCMGDARGASASDRGSSTGEQQENQGLCRRQGSGLRTERNTDGGQHEDHEAEIPKKDRGKDSDDHCDDSTEMCRQFANGQTPRAVGARGTTLSA